MDTLSQALTPAEQKRFRKLVEKFKTGRQDCAESLWHIHNEKLWREEYKSLEQFAQAEFGIQKSAAYNWIALVETKNLAATVPDLSTIVETINVEQVKGLSGLSDEKKVDVLQKAVEKAESEDKPLTANHVKAAKAELETIEPPLEEYEDVEDAPSAIDNAKYSNGLISQANILKRMLDEVPEVAGTEFLVSRRNSIKRDIESLKGSILVCKPHSFCPRCNGEGCPQCGNHGWVNKTLAKELND